jgi:hypothetical protein
LEWYVKNGWAFVERDASGAITVCAYLKLLGWAVDGVGKRYPVFKFGGLAPRDAITIRRYIRGVALPDFDDAIVVSRTHRSLGRLLVKSEFVRYYWHELKGKYRPLYRMYFGRRQPNDARDFFVKFPKSYVHPQVWQRPDRPEIYNEQAYTLAR